MAVDNGQQFAGYFGDLPPATPRRDFDLTVTELANLRWLAHGMSQVDVARLRGVCRETVNDQVAAARVKLAAKTTPHAVAIALRHGLIA